MGKLKSAVGILLAGVLTAALGACAATSPVESVRGPQSPLAATAPQKAEDIEFVKLESPPSEPPISSIFRTRYLSIPTAQGLVYQSQWIDNGELVGSGGLDLVEWPERKTVIISEDYSVSIGTFVRPQTILIQVFDTVSEMGIPVEPAISVLDCALSDFDSIPQCQLSRTESGNLLIRVPPFRVEGDAYISAYVSWLDDGVHSNTVETVSVTSLYHLLVVPGAEK